MANLARRQLHSGRRMRPIHPAMRHEETSSSQDFASGGGDSPLDDGDVSSAEQDLHWERQVDAILEAAFSD